MLLVIYWNLPVCLSIHLSVLLSAFLKILVILCHKTPTFIAVVVKVCRYISRLDIVQDNRGFQPSAFVEGSSTLELWSRSKFCHLIRVTFGLLPEGHGNTSWLVICYLIRTWFQIVLICFKFLCRPHR